MKNSKNLLIALFMVFVPFMINAAIPEDVTEFDFAVSAEDIKSVIAEGKTLLTKSKHALERLVGKRDWIDDLELGDIKTDQKKLILEQKNNLKKDSKANLVEQEDIKKFESSTVESKESFFSISPKTAILSAAVVGAVILVIKYANNK